MSPQLSDVFNSVPRILPPGGGPYLNALGNQQFVKVSCRHTGGAYAILEQVNTPGTVIPTHVHSREDETFFVLEGKVEFLTASQSIVAPPGTTVHLPRGTPHAYRVLGERTARVLVLIVPGHIQALFETLSAQRVQPSDRAQLNQLCAPYGIHFTNQPPPMPSGHG